MKPEKTRTPAALTPTVLIRERMPEKPKLEFPARARHHSEKRRALEEAARLAFKWFGPHLSRSTESTLRSQNESGRR